MESYDDMIGDDTIEIDGKVIFIDEIKLKGEISPKKKIIRYFDYPNGLTIYSGIRYIDDDEEYYGQDKCIGKDHSIWCIEPYSCGCKERDFSLGKGIFLCKKWSEMVTVHEDDCLVWEDQIFRRRVRRDR